MQDAKPILFIINPASAGGKTMTRWQEVLPVLRASGLSFKTAKTQAPNDAYYIALAATSEQSAKIIVSVGGDGTANEIINGIMAASQPNTRPVFTIFPSGTGSDTVRTLAIPKDIQQFIQLLKEGQPTQIDLGLAQFNQKQRYFINISDVGIGAQVTKRVNEVNQSEAKSSKAKYFNSILRQVIHFQAYDAYIKSPLKQLRLKQTVIVAICNGRFFGGGVKISPLSKVTDGKLELIASQSIPKFGLLGLIPKIYKGSHIIHKKVVNLSDARFHIKLKQPQLLETDGEVQEMVNEVTFITAQKALRVLLPEISSCNDIS